MHKFTRFIAAKIRESVVRNWRGQHNRNLTEYRLWALSISCVWYDAQYDCRALWNILFNVVKSISNQIKCTGRATTYQIKIRVYLLFRGFLVRRLLTLGYRDAGSSRGWWQIVHGCRERRCLWRTGGWFVEFSHGSQLRHRGNWVAIHLVNVSSNFVQLV